jgi:NADH:ubiquinone reductase (H+-translocating)
MAVESTRIVIVGGGFAGLACARQLARRPGLEITLIDKNNYHQFQPMLYQVATSQLAASDLAYSLRKVFAGWPQVRVKLAEIAAVDPKAKTVTAKTGEVFSADYLVLAAGAIANFFKTPGAEENSFPLYSLVDAERLRSRILTVFDDSDRDPKRIEQGSLNFVIVGAGPTGVETAGALADLLHDTATEYPQIKKGLARIYLVDHGKRVLGAFSESAHTYAAKVLEESGVEIRLGIAVKEVAPGHVVLSDGTRILTRTVVWAGGLMASPLATCGMTQGHGGRIDTQPDLTVAGFPGVYALGDLANIPGADGKTLPQLGSVALQSGQWAANNILAQIDGKKAVPFDYEDKGIMAMINRNSAVVEMGEKRHELHGHLAVAAWIGVHTYLMTGVRNRFDAFVSWVWNHFAKTRGSRVLDRSSVARIDWGEDVDSVEPESPA